MYSEIQQKNVLSPKFSSSQTLVQFVKYNPYLSFNILQNLALKLKLSVTDCISIVLTMSFLPYNKRMWTWHILIWFRLPLAYRLLRTLITTPKIREYNRANRPDSPTSHFFLLPNLSASSFLPVFFKWPHDKLKENWILVLPPRCVLTDDLLAS